VFTVVIAEKQLLKDISDNDKLLGYMYDKTQVAFCEWHAEKNNFNSAVPQLQNLVYKKEQWRAVVICDESLLTRDNPFDYVDYYPVIKGVTDDAERHKQTLMLYEKAMDNPLVKLTARLCPKPVVTAEYDEEAPVQLQRYQTEINKKLELWNGLISEDDLTFVYPSELLCIARRTCDNEKRKVDDVWGEHHELSYSRFYEYNMYFDNMRYLVFDMLDKKNVEYKWDYFRFLMTILTVANNTTPRGCLSPNRIYKLSSEFSRHNVQYIISGYDKKLDNTEQFILNEIKQLELIPPQYMTEDETDRLFDERIDVLKDRAYSISESDCYVDDKVPGITTDKPRSESGYWTEAFEKSYDAVQRILKASRRMLKRATGTVSEKCVADSKCEKLLEEFQQEDIIEYAQRNEIMLMENQPESIYDVDEQFELMEKHNEVVRDNISKRMTSLNTLLLSVVILFIVALGGLPYIISCLKTDEIMKPMTLAIYAGLLGSVFIAVIIILLIFRHRLVVKFREYNSIMKSFVERVDNTNVDYSVYLSRICNLMRAYSIIDRDKYNLALSFNKIQMMKKHIADIRGEREVIRDIMGQFIVPYGTSMDEYTDYFEYDFVTLRRYSYPMVNSALTSKKIVYMQNGNYAVVSGGLLDKVTVEREELYD